MAAREAFQGMWRIIVCIIGFFTMGAAVPAEAAGWRFDGRQGALSFDEGDFRPSLRCVGSRRIAILVPGNGARFDPERSYTVSLSVDGLAFILSTAPAFGSGARTDFMAVAPMTAIEPLLAALAKGREVEVAGPTGRWRLPLSGSAAGVSRLRQACA